MASIRSRIGEKMKTRNNMAENKAIKILQRDLQIQLENKALPDGIEAIQIAIQALEKQIPKKPVHDGCLDSEGMWHEWNGVNGRPYDLCPNCNTNLCCEMPNDNKPNYCSKCGCRLDWSDDDDD